MITATLSKMQVPARQFVESLEERIAPAGLDNINFQAAPAGTSILLSAGQGLATGDDSGSYLLYVEKGQALVFTTDLNANGIVDMNEITGIAAGNGLRLVSFVDINGDIVTNLNPDGTLTDSNGDPSDGNDGRIVLNSSIESITLRSLTAADVINPSFNLSKSNYSIFGNIYAGGGLGTTVSYGLTIDPSGFALQSQKFSQLTLQADETPIPSIGFIYTGSAVNGKYFSFGTSPDFGDGPTESLRGELSAFVPAAGQAGGDVIGVRAGTGTSEAFQSAPYHISGIVTGEGGFGAKGGDIRNVSIHGDIGGLVLRTGSGGAGETGGHGGNLTGLSITDSINSRVLIQTGDGGFGFIGAAGNAGNINFNGTLELYANIEIGLGKGGNALGNAGSGTSLAGGTFKNISINSAELTPAEFVSTWRQPGDIGQTTPIDFDGDGNFDAIFLSDNPNQVVILFGTGDAGFEIRPQFSYLDSPSFASIDTRFSAVAVADISDDLLPDIVTASSSGTSGGGLRSFVNLGSDANGWLGFGDARYSPLPGGNIPSTSPANIGINLLSNAAITNIAAGDFDGDGFVDMGIIEVRYDNTNVPYISNLIVMKGLTDGSGKPDGYFAADFGKGTGDVIRDTPAVNLEFGLNKETGENFSYILKATAAEDGEADTDLLGLLNRVDKTPNRTNNTTLQFFQIVDGVEPEDPDTLLKRTSDIEPRYSTRVIDSVTIGEVTTQEWVGYGGTNLIQMKDFTFLDVGGDGIFDVAGIGTVLPSENQPTLPYLAAVVLEGAANGIVTEPDYLEDNEVRPSWFSADRAYFGIALTENLLVERVLASDRQNIQTLRLVAGDYTNGANLAGNFYDAAIPAESRSFASGFEVTGFGQYGGEFTNITDIPVLRSFTRIGTEGKTLTSLFDTYTNFDGDILTEGFIGPNPGQTNPRWNVSGETISASTLTLRAGDGGYSLLGRGGNGGSLGTGSIQAGQDGNLQGSLDLSGFNAYLLVTGNGGSGFLGGGSAGNISGLITSVSSGVSQDFEDLAANTLLVTNSGADGLFGTGGHGGSVRNIFSSGGALAIATGDGGQGTTGGSGGSIIGRGGSDLLDAAVPRVFLTTGNGGFGINLGGSGGSITNFTPQMGVSSSTGLIYHTGDGGNSSAGTGGVGGAITSSGPSTTLVNGLRGMIELTSGDGGDGLTGGAGGSITGFVNRPTTNFNPTLATVIAGDGGDGVTGTGGRGGMLSNISIAAAAFTEDFSLNAFLAGNGGSSSAGAGGVGGAISNLTTTATSNGASVVIAGEGGRGLTAGGAGGALTNNSVNAGGLNFAKIVAMAGAGGDALGVNQAQINKEGTAPFSAFSFLFAMGTINGRGGIGGSIVGFTQPASVQANATDLIAGNGGSTINYGKAADTVTGVGRGGSISNTNLFGDAGRISAAVPIVGYDPNFAATIRDGSITQITDASGNVGVIVGAAGFVKGDSSVTGGVAGSVTNFKAKNIMSMVAGSVDRMAVIVSINSLSLQNGGTIIGAGKETPLEPNPPRVLSTDSVYLDSNGNIVSDARSGGSLIDGAILTFSYKGTTPASSLRIFDL